MNHQKLKQFFFDHAVSIRDGLLLGIALFILVALSGCSTSGSLDNHMPSCAEVRQQSLFSSDSNIGTTGPRIVKCYEEPTAAQKAAAMEAHKRLMGKRFGDSMTADKK